MISRQQIDKLLRFQQAGYLVTSCYLTLDRTKMPAQMLKIRVKDLLQAAQHELAAKAATHEQRESLREDFKRIEQFALQEIVTNHHRGLAVFSCAGQKFWQTYRLPRLVRNILIADRDPYIRPLTSILAEYHRYCTVLVDRIHGKIFEVYMGQILEHTEMLNSVPRRVREGGYQGREERQIERRHDHAVHQHFQDLADATFNLFKRDQFDYLVLGGHRDVLSLFKQHLHPYLKQRWAGDFHCEPGKIASADVLRHALDVEDQVEWQHERRLASELVQKAQAGDLAVSGVGATLGALAKGEAQTLLVEDGLELPGYVCYRCHFTHLEPGQCPQCHQPTEPCPDVVDEAIELALAKNCAVEHVRGPTALREAGRMGALLRFRSPALQAQ
jgi:peptide chain release factor subunit 1